MRVLITGGTGFIGRRCIEALSRTPAEIFAVTIDDVPQDDPRVTWLRGDLLDPGDRDRIVAETNATHLLHLAWYVAHGRFWTAAENLDWTQASVGLFRAFAAHGGERIVAAGTCAEYDWSYGYCSEAVTPLKPATPYGACKNALQSLLAAFADVSKISWAWGRVFHLYGPGEHPARLAASVASSVLRGEPARCSHGDQIRDFLHVDDVAGAFAALLASDVNGPVNIASGEPIRIKDLVLRIADEAGRRDLVRLGAIPPADNDPPLLVADVRRLRDEVGWTQTIDMDEGIRDTVAWWRQRLLEGQAGA